MLKDRDTPPLNPQLTTLVRLTPTHKIDAETKSTSRRHNIPTTTHINQSSKSLLQSIHDQYDVISSMQASMRSSSMRSFFDDTFTRNINELDTLRCPICLDEFCVGDEVCWSHNKECLHIHHLDCIVNWLMDHDKCPLCRQEFV